MFHDSQYEDDHLCLLLGLGPGVGRGVLNWEMSSILARGASSLVILVSFIIIFIIISSFNYHHLIIALTLLSKNCCRNKLTFNPWTWKLPIQESAHDKICKTASTTILHECITYSHIHQTHICVGMFAVWPAWWYWSECLGIRVRYWQSIGYLYCVYCTHACLYCTHSHYGWRNNEYIYLRRRWAELPADIRRGWWQYSHTTMQ